MKSLYDQISDRYIKYITQQIEEETQGFIEISEEVEEFIYGLSGYKKSTILLPMNEGFREYVEKFRGLVKSMDEPFMLFVVGMGKYGKSTLLNALMQQKAAEVDELPKTWKIDVFKSDPQETMAKMKYKDGKERRVSVKFAQTLIKSEELKRIDSEKQVNQKLREFKKKGVSKEELKEYKKALMEEILYVSKLAEVHWPVNPAPLLENFFLVDTPGLVQKVMGEVKESVREYYHKADGVLWMLDANTISAEKSKELIMELSEHLNAVGQINPQNIIEVLNRIDNIRENHGEEGVQRIVKEAERIYEGYFSRIVPISAQEAFNGFENKDRDLIEKSGIENLLAEIESAFLRKSREIRMMSKKFSLKSLLHSTANHINAYFSRLKDDKEKLDMLMGKFISEIKNKENDLLREMESILKAHKQLVDSNIDLYADSLFDIESESGRERKIKDKIFEISHLTKKVEDLYNKTDKQSVEIFNYYRGKVEFSKYQLLEGKELAELNRNAAAGSHTITEANFDTDGWSFASGTGIAIISTIFLGPIGLLLGPLSGFLGINKWLARKFKLSDLKRDLRTSFEKSAKDMKAEYRNNVGETFRGIRGQIEEIAFVSFAGLHGDGKEAGLLLDEIEAFRPELSNWKVETSFKEFIAEEIYIKSKRKEQALLSEKNKKSVSLSYDGREYDVSKAST